MDPDFLGLEAIDVVKNRLKEEEAYKVMDDGTEKRHGRRPAPAEYKPGPALLPRRSQGNPQESKPWPLEAPPW